MKKIVVTGGRNFSDKDFVYKILNKFLSKESFILIHGDATGLDSLAKEWVIENNVDQMPYPALWKDFNQKPCVIKYGQFGKYNCLAGFNRNQQMIDEGKPNLCLAFPGGDGTKDMKKRCIKYKIPVINFDPNAKDEE